MKLFIVRATLSVALSFSASVAFTQGKSGKSETHGDIIEKAYNLSLQKDRQQALNILTSAIRHESKPSAVAELKKTITDVARIFFSDKTQQLFEMGVSLRKMDLSQAVQKVTEAYRLEPDNSVIVAELARLNIARGDCSAAEDLVSKQLRLSPYEEDLRLAQAQALVCQGPSKDRKQRKAKDHSKSALQKFWLAVEIEKCFKNKDVIGMQENLEALGKLDPKYPELPYWNWRRELQKKTPNPEFAQKYVMNCKNISASQYREYMIDPMLCRRVAEVESELKGLNENIE